MIELKNICKNYEGGGNTVQALKNINLSFRQNEFVAVLGPSGGGKTTMLNIIGGLDKYTSGDLIINGKSTVKFKDKDWDAYRNHTVGFVFQSYNLIPHQNVISNVELALTIGGISRTERIKRAKEALEKVGLGDQLYKKPNQLSGGQMQRVAIARALVNDPDVLLADEPTGALDTQNSVQIMDLLKEVAKDRLVIMVTHNPDLAEQYANRIVRIRDGEITSDSNPFVESDEENPNTSMGKASMGILTSFLLSLNNLFTKKARTALVSVAGSIGIIGISLIIALSNGVNYYIDTVQKNSLSSYPLTIQKSDVDTTTAMMNMASNHSQEEKVEGKITETEFISNMFNQIGVNNLSLFKKYMDDNAELVNQYLTSVQYYYGISPQIYNYDTSDGVTKINPSTLYSSFFAYDYSSYSGSDTFQQLIDDEDLLDEQFDIIAGRWPQQYDELVLVLYSDDSISDFMLYSLGIRDPKELEKYISQAMAGEKVDIERDKMVFEPEDFLELKYRLVSSSDYYKYDETYNVWNDMRDDKDYMKQLVDNGLELRVVGVVCPKKGVNATVMTSGVGYRKELMDYVFDYSSKTAIVESQLADKTVDVFSQMTFEEINSENKNTRIDFGNIISVDSRQLSRAFTNNVNVEALTADMNVLVNDALNEIIADSGDVLGELTGFVTDMTSEMINDYLDEHGEQATYSQEDIKEMVEKQFAKESTKERIAQMEEVFGLPAGYLEPLLKPAVEEVLLSYSALAEKILNMEAPITRDKIMDIIESALSSSSSTETLNNLARSLMQNSLDQSLEKVMGEATQLLAKNMQNAFRVDTNALQKAFKFTMTEEELTRIMMTFMNANNNDKTVDGNLRDLGYADIDDPYMINLYFRDFDSKEKFKALMDDYNTTARNEERAEDVIVYTDITGILISSVSDIINAISYVLIAFVSVSLLVSSIMIAIITYISVLERTKEIGILRALGASKRNVSTVFMAETFIIGLCSGLFGVIITQLLCIPINSIILKATGVVGINCYLPVHTAITMIIISIVLTVIAGIIPSSMASKRDPVAALRTE